MNTRSFLTAVVAGLACAPMIHAQTPAKPADPWAKVPALPTACYSGQDDWGDKNGAALVTVQQAKYRQYDINADIRQKAIEMDEADPMAIAQRMQQAMMEDPQNAQKILEQMLQTGQQAQTEMPERLEKEQQLEADGKDVMKQYAAALARAMGPAETRWSALRNKLGLPKDANHPGELGVPDWAWAEWDAILRDRDRAYVANCAQWWSATGPIHAYLKRYRDFLVQERTPYLQKLEDESTLQKYRLQGIPTNDYRTTTDYQAAEDYMKMASVIFDRRENQPRCGSVQSCY